MMFLRLNECYRNGILNPPFREDSHKGIFLQNRYGLLPFFYIPPAAPPPPISMFEESGQLLGEFMSL